MKGLKEEQKGTTSEMADHFMQRIETQFPPVALRRTLLRPAAAVVLIFPRLNDA